MDITNELLDDLQQKAQVVIGDNLQYCNEPMYAPRFGLTPVEQEFAAAAHPEVVDALVEHIRSMTERMEKAEKDAARYRFVIDCPIRTMVALSRKAHERDFDLSAECDQLIAAIALEGANHE